jgi:hypothetical protein
MRHLRHAGDVPLNSQASPCRRGAIIAAHGDHRRRSRSDGVIYGVMTEMHMMGVTGGYGMTETSSAIMVTSPEVAPEP